MLPDVNMQTSKFLTGSYLETVLLDKVLGKKKEPKTYFRIDLVKGRLTLHVRKRGVPRYPPAQPHILLEEPSKTCLSSG